MTPPLLLYGVICNPLIAGSVYDAASLGCHYNYVQFFC